MAVFTYKATDQKGKFVEGNVDAPDYHVAVKRIQQLNYFPIQVSESKSKKFGVGKINLPGVEFFNKIPQKEILGLTQQLSTLVGSGITLDSSLSSLAKLNENPKVRQILSDVQRRVYQGGSFAEALSEHPRAFSKLYVNMVRAGEEGGVLTTCMDRLAQHMEKSENLKSSIRTAMIYPAVLTLVGGSAVVFLVTVVIPRFSKIFEDMGKALPLPTKIILGLSAVVTSYWWMILLVFALATVGLIYYLKTETGRFQWDSLLLKLPLFGSLVRKIEVSRFSLTLSTLLKSGVPVLHALGIVKSILGNSVIVTAMTPLMTSLKNGKGLSGSLDQSGVFPPMAVHMIAVGEASGNLDEMLEKVSNTYDKEVEIALKQVISLIEPMMILVMALIIGFIVVSMLMAILSVNELAF